MYFLAMFGWKSGDSRKRKKNSYTSCGGKGASLRGIPQGLGEPPCCRAQSAPLPTARPLPPLLWYLEMRPGGLQGGLIFLGVKLGPSGI